MKINGDEPLERERAMMTISKLNERFEHIEAAYKAALAGRDPTTVFITDLLPAIFAAVPDTTTDEIADALRWSARKNFREAEELRRFGRERRER
jgi:hypothetical protein